MEDGRFLKNVGSVVLNPTDTPLHDDLFAIANLTSRVQPYSIVDVLDFNNTFGRHLRAESFVIGFDLAF